jgi:superfamily I DNA/RNA helicase
MGLNKAQAEAVSTPQNSVLQILAGPGSGKTKVLTHRVCFLLEQGVLPENIILTTFTNVFPHQLTLLMTESGTGDEGKNWQAWRKWSRIEAHYRYRCWTSDGANIRDISFDLSQISSEIRLIDISTKRFRHCRLG